VSRHDWWRGFTTAVHSRTGSIHSCLWWICEQWWWIPNSQCLFAMNSLLYASHCYSVCRSVQYEIPCAHRGTVLTSFADLICSGFPMYCLIHKVLAGGNIWILIAFRLWILYTMLCACALNRLSYVTVQGYRPHGHQTSAICVGRPLPSRLNAKRLCFLKSLWAYEVCWWPTIAAKMNS